MAIYQLRTEQKIPTSIDKVWDFISSPRNLAKITPEYMGFTVTNEPIAEKMYPGQIISYKVSPVLGIPMTWVTEITQVRDREYFVDEQRVGPYAMWHHEHFIEEVNDGVMMRDIVSYAPPLGFLGQIANAVFIKRQLQQIFDYRFQAVVREFGTAK
jgi:ligand-binding SRPBCC domain-containing protein